MKKSKFDEQEGYAHNPIFPLDAYRKNKGYPKLHNGFVQSMIAEGWTQLESHKFVHDFPKKRKYKQPYQIEMWVVNGEWFFEYKEKPGYEDFHKTRGPNSFPFNAVGQKFTGVRASMSWRDPLEEWSDTEENKYKGRYGHFYMEGIFKQLAKYLTVTALTLDDYI